MHFSPYLNTPTFETYKEPSSRQSGTVITWRSFYVREIDESLCDILCDRNLSMAVPPRIIISNINRPREYLNDQA